MEVGDKVAFYGERLYGGEWIVIRDDDYWQVHLSLWIFKFGIVIGFPRPLLIESIDRFNLVKAGGHVEDISSFRPYRWWFRLLWR